MFLGDQRTYSSLYGMKNKRSKLPCLNRFTMEGLKSLLRSMPGWTKANNTYICLSLSKATHEN